MSAGRSCLRRHQCGPRQGGRTRGGSSPTTPSPWHDREDTDLPCGCGGGGRRRHRSGIREPNASDGGGFVVSGRGWKKQKHARSCTQTLPKMAWEHELASIPFQGCFGVGGSRSANATTQKKARSSYVHMSRLTGQIWRSNNISLCNICIVDLK
jgi:hypothetical protein